MVKRIQSIFLSTVLIASLVSFSLGWFFADNLGNPNKESVFAPGNTSQNGMPPVQDLAEVWSKLKADYYDPSKLEISKLGFGAAKGLVSAIQDPYTVFMTPEESKEFGNELDGQLEGIGAQLEAKDGNLIVVAPIKNSPAEKAGIRAGDIILKINDEFAENLTLYEAVNRIRGKKGTKVKLIVLHEDESEPVEIEVTRAEILIDTITLKKLEGDIFHLSINQFNDHTKNEFQNAIQKILLERASGVIIDVRGNGGGYLDIAVDLLSEMITGEKPTVIIQKRDLAQNETFKTSGNAKLGDVPLVVLIDRGSASASEILAGALQDYKRAVLIGETTFGKGTVQEVSEFADGARLRFTIARWLTPLQRSVDGVGIAPDIEVKFTKEDAAAERDPQLDAAVTYLRNARM